MGSSDNGGKADSTTRSAGGGETPSSDGSGRARAGFGTGGGGRRSRIAWVAASDKGSATATAGDGFGSETSSAWTSRSWNSNGTGSGSSSKDSSTGRAEAGSILKAGFWAAGAEVTLRLLPADRSELVPMQMDPQKRQRAVIVNKEGRMGEPPHIRVTRVVQRLQECSRQGLHSGRLLRHVVTCSLRRVSPTRSRPCLGWNRRGMALGCPHRFYPTGCVLFRAL